ncbi:hypothetical protein [Streptomyces sp. NBC_00887]|uniref:hypothetical protein n=1 Tax=Streptomyces sp. NBC_00887 TaxID=2975859 RepID=UPI00386A1BBA|nr:hypothetical protein OG844_05265 [Streptomyces sp. NBC_00887]WSY35510.1 hypothetical protein OG844_40335 [Streptomyces sp. NBC_00887]
MRATVGTVLITLAATVALSGCADDVSSENGGSNTGGDGVRGGSNAAAVAYKITEREEVGAVRNVLVQVDSDDRLPAVFDAVKAELTEEAVYVVGIECTTGGDEYDRRLANGRYVVGAAGSAEAGLPAGTTEYQAAGGKCPA